MLSTTVSKQTAFAFEISRRPAEIGGATFVTDYILTKLVLWHD